MKLYINSSASELYLKHIVQEVFSQDFLKSHSDDLLSVNISEVNDTVLARAELLGFSSSFQENVLNHPSANVARTCSIGKCVIDLGKRLEAKPLPYGVLTGVRPLKIANELAKRYGISNVAKMLEDIYLVKRNKGEILTSCVGYDEIVRSQHDDSDVSLYISIPFCPSRCNYCSFVSSSIENKRGLIPLYLDHLINEMHLVAETLDKVGSTVKSIYVGGGTPGILSETELKRLLDTIKSLFISNNIKEFSFELGRPDTVTQEKLELLRKNFVDRICINAQTTNNDVLRTINRRHTAEQYFNALSLSQGYGFKSINTDLIAGLDGEDLNSFEKSLTDVIDTGVDNVTVHTLCVKKSSALRKARGTELSCRDIDKFAEYSQKYCINSGFEPYYLYRQKYALGNHDSIGWCKGGNYSYYNIAMMNEIETVIGMGAGATSRVVSKNECEKYQHFENYKYPYDYIRDDKKMLTQIEQIAQALNHQ